MHSLIRSESQIAALKSLGATPIVHSIETTTVASLTSLIQSLTPAPAAIIWTAGAGGGSPARTQKVDRDGAIIAFDAAAAAGLKRFIMVSAMDMRDRDSKPVPDWYNAEDKKSADGMWSALPDYMAAKLAADTELVEGNKTRGLRYTIVRPGVLSEEEGTGMVRAGRIHFGGKVPREDVARVLLECLRNERTVGLAFDVLGGERSIEEEVGRVVRGKEDCFEGFH